MKRADVAEFEVPERGDYADVENVRVAFVDVGRELLLCGFEVHRHEVGEL